jgi:hypothetical protein
VSCMPWSLQKVWGDPVTALNRPGLSSIVVRKVPSLVVLLGPSTVERDMELELELELELGMHLMHLMPCIM